MTTPRQSKARLYKRLWDILPNPQPPTPTGENMTTTTTTTEVSDDLLWGIFVTALEGAVVSVQLGRRD
jgi:hypothetical protein